MCINAVSPGCSLVPIEQLLASRRPGLDLHSKVAFSGASSLRISMDLLPWEVLSNKAVSSQLMNVGNHGVTGNMMVVMVLTYWRITSGETPISLPMLYVESTLVSSIKYRRIKAYT